MERDETDNIIAKLSPTQADAILGNPCRESTIDALLKKQLAIRGEENALTGHPYRWTAVLSDSGLAVQKRLLERAQ